MGSSSVPFVGAPLQVCRKSVQCHHCVSFTSLFPTGVSSKTIAAIDFSGLSVQWGLQVTAPPIFLASSLCSEITRLAVGFSHLQPCPSVLPVVLFSLTLPHVPLPSTKATNPAAGCCLCSLLQFLEDSVITPLAYLCPFQLPLLQLAHEEWMFLSLDNVQAFVLLALFCFVLEITSEAVRAVFIPP